MCRLLKYTGYLLLWIALATIITHGIIPHHHHFGKEERHQVCEKELDHNSGSYAENEHHILSFHHETNENKECNECHFKTDVTVNQNNTYLLSSEYFISDQQINIDIALGIFSFADFTQLYSFLKTRESSSRAPPLNC